MGSKERKKQESRKTTEAPVVAADEIAPPAPRVPWHVHLIIAAGICGIIIAAYHNSFGASFHLDDAHVVQNNPAILSPDLIPKYFSRSFRENPTVRAGGDFYRPILFITYAFDVAISGLGPDGKPSPKMFHVTNVVFHAFVVLVLYALVLTLLKTPRFRSTAAAGVPVYVAACSALLFGLHPVQTESVSYVSSRSEILVTLFLLLSVTAYLRGRLSEGLKGRITWAAASALFFILASLSKEYGLFLPIVLIGMEFLAFPGLRFETRAKRLVAFIVLLFILGGIHQSFRSDPAARLMDLPKTNNEPFEYFAIQGRVLWHYFRIILAPVWLVFDYNNDASIINAASWIKAAGWLFTGGLIALIVLTWRRFPPYALAALWFFLFLLPVSSFFPIYDVIFEHRLYAPLVFWGFLIAAAVAAACGKNRRMASVVLVGLTVLIGGFYGAATYARNKVYENPGTLWKDVIDKVPNNSRARLNYANWLYDMANTAWGKKDYRQYERYMNGAIEQMREVVRFLPSGHKSELGWNNLGKTTMTKALRILEFARTAPEGEREKLTQSARKHLMQALRYLDKALKEYDFYSVARLNKGMTLLHLADLDLASGNAAGIDFSGYKLYTEALRQFGCSIDIEKDPNNVMNFRYLLQSHERLMDNSYKLALLYSRNNFHRKARSIFQKCRKSSQVLIDDALRFISPAHPLVRKAHLMIARISWIHLGDPSTALQHLEEYFRIPGERLPSWLEARLHYGEILLKTGNTLAGRQILEEVVRAAPPGSGIRNRAAALLRASPKSP